MELKIARADLHTKKKNEAKISLDEIKTRVQEHNEHAFYLDGTNTHKDMQKAKASLEKSGLRVQLNEVRYGLDDNTYIYELYVV
ncbi:MAG: hypothetical protein MR629_07250 [Helicobacter sp.]|uniref:HP0268 family nuclease n=1 Tax=Helicobacter sp. 10-6591 TaxID=2004998 RepID=UPI000DCBE1EC|nr:HP0268 family nuclease [Helicobacter sp. 10-6591]MCI6218308.1 hypothetical protein [Helicobacter sp.]MCI7485413.1 hypothetical protein [Helicobacter sp.]MDD7567739.1 HP0268 family nuclease [Helicobacter sp.]MDY5741070.1 HP0268 family nuclease [Helicobacter sp.]RAX53973.1 hypothetical protein CCY97_06655 [Helicobacter sp. 10-6591]